jgi:hypothetical protein
MTDMRSRIAEWYPGQIISHTCTIENKRRMQQLVIETQTDRVRRAVSESTL